MSTTEINDRTKAAQTNAAQTIPAATDDDFSLFAPIDGITASQFWVRLMWVTLQLSVVWFFLSSDDPFFYQGF